MVWTFQPTRTPLNDVGATAHAPQVAIVDEFEITDEETFDDLRRRMEYVDGTREYPTTFTMWSQILLSLILPKAVQMLLQAI